MLLKNFKEYKMIRQRKIVDSRVLTPDLYDVQERIVFLCESANATTVTVQTQWETVIERVTKEAAIKLLHSVIL